MLQVRGHCRAADIPHHATLTIIFIFRDPLHKIRCLWPQVPKAYGALSKVELARAKRGGKGKHGFKSKARHKRR